jgi:hypothetical protein
MKAREIELGDAFIALKIIKKLGLESLRNVIGIESVEEPTPEETEGKTIDEIKGIRDAKKNELLKKKAFEVITYLLSHLEEAEKEILLLLSGWACVEPEEFKKIKLSELPKFIDEFMALNSKDTLISFFERAVAALTK